MNGMQASAYRPACVTCWHW